MSEGRNFYFRVVSPKLAIEIFNDQKIELFILYDDDSEVLIENENELHEAINLGIDLAIENKF